MTNVWYNEDIHHLTHPCSVRCVFIYYITFYITYTTHQIIERSGVCHPVRENRTHPLMSLLLCLVTGNNVPSNSPSVCFQLHHPPYAVWSGFNVLLSRGFQQRFQTEIIFRGETQTQSMFSLFVSQEGDEDWGQMLELINSGGSEEIPDRWPHLVSLSDCCTQSCEIPLEGLGTLNPPRVFHPPLGRCLQSESIETIPIHPVPLWTKFPVKKKKAKVPI